MPGIANSQNETDSAVHVSPQPQALEDHLASVLGGQEPEPWLKSFIRNIKETFSPPELPPLEVTSKPVAVKDIWSGSENVGKSRFVSVGIHFLVITALLILGTSPTMQKLAKDSVALIAPDLAPYKPAPQKKNSMGGGGGGGDRSPTPASKGKLPKIAPRQFTPPMAVVNNPKPKLVMEPTLVIQPDANLPQVNMPVLGDPLSGVKLASNGPGSGGGIGSGPGGGVGSGGGPGFGPGSGGNTGGGAYKIGGGVSAPAVILKVEPEYSEEARKAKFQGTVLLSVVVDEKGNPRDLRVVRPLGLGLDEKAIEAVMKWRFRPGLKDGRAVPVSAYVEVNFRLL
jgi:TonB family protein